MHLDFYSLKKILPILHVRRIRGNFCPFHKIYNLLMIFFMKLLYICIFKAKFVIIFNPRRIVVQDSFKNSLIYYFIFLLLDKFCIHVNILLFYIRLLNNILNLFYRHIVIKLYEFLRK